jgi:hypothetical protein
VVSVDIGRKFSAAVRQPAAVPLYPCGIGDAMGFASALGGGGYVEFMPARSVPLRHAWRPLRQGSSERTMCHEPINRQGERMPWTSDCKANMRS